MDIKRQDSTALLLYCAELLLFTALPAERMGSSRMSRNLAQYTRHQAETSLARTFRFSNISIKAFPSYVRRLATLQPKLSDVTACSLQPGHSARSGLPGRRLAGPGGPPAVASRHLLLLPRQPQRHPLLLLRLAGQHGAQHPQDHHQARHRNRVPRRHHLRGGQGFSHSQRWPTNWKPLHTGLVAVDHRCCLTVPQLMGEVERELYEFFRLGNS